MLRRRVLVPIIAVAAAALVVGAGRLMTSSPEITEGATSALTAGASRAPGSSSSASLASSAAGPTTPAATGTAKAKPVATKSRPATAASKKAPTTKGAAKARATTKARVTKKPTTRPTTPAGGGSTSSGSSSKAAQVLAITNRERAKAGCKALTTSSKLTTAAQGHSADMAAKNYFSHDSQDGRSPFDRMKDAGYSFSAAAENIAMGQPTPTAVMDAWMNSPGHKANILNCTYTQIGIGYAVGNGSPYWTQDFGKPL